jgi:SAM-dependent methyltransferase/uncharacterized protein YbaR (Trm112 family)
VKRELLTELVCPVCEGVLQLASVDVEQTFGEHRAEIMSGWIACTSCEERFPVIKGVPRMLVGELRQGLGESYPGFFKHSRQQSRVSPEGKKKLSTMHSFGYEWTHFSDIRPEGEGNSRWYFATCTPENWRGKRILDLGCGKGRHLFYTSRYGAMVIGVDLSPAVDAAFTNAGHQANVHIIQADLFHLPLRRHSFDVIYSLGVLHHLPNPEAGFREFLTYGCPGAEVLIYLYWKLTQAPAWQRAVLTTVSAFRRLTTRLPFTLLRLLCLPIAVGCLIVFVWPYKLLRRSRLRVLAESLPLKAYADYPFRVLYQDQFDRLSAPIEYRYDREEVLAWLDRAGLVYQQLLAGGGWRASGYIPTTEAFDERTA